MSLVLTARRADRLDAVAEPLRAAGADVTVLVGDVTDDGMSDRLLDAAPVIHAVFANAGYGATATVLDRSLDEDRRLFEVNYFAAVDLLQRAATRLRAAGRPGHLLMNSSCLAKFSLPRHGAYAASKAAQDSWCRAARLELEPDGIHVSSVHPITTRTEFFDVSAGEVGGSGTVGPPRHTPRAFVQTPEQVARAVVRCLRRPVPEVWTSPTTRTVAGLITMFPRLGDAILRRQAARDDA